MTELLHHVNQWHWLAFSLLMLLLELSRLKGWSFVVGAAAFFVGLTLHFEVMTWPFQWTLFFIGVLIFAFIRALVVNMKSSG
ncbi:hypothetical protein [Motilimonas eburnea]|uniref:hypothetical protein n=1 Tax=Motilimonas eburnea TaxID=1737488 RepID=UPI001E5714DC|nr:hypothetical protein [Motilimonas eburnea]MCE2570832.1 hypothetical protein [Motilimonas eburnea]